MPDKFVIYRDIPKSHEIKIHRINCIFYVTRDVHATTSKWCLVSSYYDAQALAEKLSQKHKIGYRDCKKCKPSNT